MLIKSFKLNKKMLIVTIILLVLATSIIIFYSFATDSSNSEEKSEEKKDFIKWVDFNVSYEALNLTSKLDIDSHNEDAEIKYNWVQLLAYLACKNGGNFKNFKKADLDNLVNLLKERRNNGRFNSKFKVL